MIIKRLIGITLIGWALVVLGGLFLASAFFSLSGFAVPINFILKATAGVPLIFVGWAILKLKPWAWWIVVIVNGVQFANGIWFLFNKTLRSEVNLDVFTFTFTFNVVSVLISATLFYYFIRRPVRDQFRRPSTPNNSPKTVQPSGPAV